MSSSFKNTHFISQVAVILLLAACASYVPENTPTATANANSTLHMSETPPATAENAAAANTALLRRFRHCEFATPSDWKMGLIQDGTDHALVSTFSADGTAVLSIAHSPAKGDVETALQQYLPMASQIYPNAKSSPLASFGRYNSGVGRTLTTRLQAGIDGRLREMQVDLYFVIVAGQLFRLERMIPAEAPAALRQQMDTVTEHLELR